MEPSGLGNRFDMDPKADASVKALLTGYPVMLALPVQWGDQDSFRHVNNAVYFRWYESGRIAYNRRIGIMTDDPAATVGPILAATSNNYRRQVAYPDTVHVGVRVVKIGRASLGFEHRERVPSGGRRRRNIHIGLFRL